MEIKVTKSGQSCGVEISNIDLTKDLNEEHVKQLQK